MAKRLNLNHDEETRRKIQTSQLLNRLKDHVFEGKEVSQTQLKAIEILLRKSLPDLSTVTVSGDPNNPLKQDITIYSGVPRWKSGPDTKQENNSSPSTQGKKDGQP